MNFVNKADSGYRKTAAPIVLPATTRPKTLRTLCEELWGEQEVNYSYDIDAQAITLWPVKPIEKAKSGQEATPAEGGDK